MDFAESSPFWFLYGNFVGRLKKNKITTFVTNISFDAFANISFANTFD